MKKQLSILLLLGSLLHSCIGDDIIFDTVLETLRISNPIDTFALGDTYQLEVRYTNNIGQEETPSITWMTSTPQTVSIDQEGLIRGLAIGEGQVMAEVLLPDSRTISDTLQFLVANQTTLVEEISNRTGEIAATSSYTLEGDFEISIDNSDHLLIEFADNYEASSSLPGLYLYLTNNPNTISGALEIGKVEVFKGAHSYTIEGVDIKEYDYLLYYCKPFSVKVGDGQIN